VRYHGKIITLLAGCLVAAGAIAAQLIGLGATAQAGTLLVAGSPEYDEVTGNGFTYGAGPLSPERIVMNNSGTAVAYVTKYESGNFKGTCAVRWDALGMATELGHLGTDSSGKTSALAYAINDAGTVVGDVTKYESGSYVGHRAVRWDASGTTATELDNLGTDSAGETNAGAVAVNEAGRPWVTRGSTRAAA
jgi:uncharacterized membrane protein